MRCATNTTIIPVAIEGLVSRQASEYPMIFK